MKYKLLSILTIVILLTCSSWGFLVHRTVHQLAVYQLPDELSRFFYRNMDYVVKHAPRPDNRRSTDSTEATKHFIDLEMYGDSAVHNMPYDWDKAVALYTKDSLQKYGYVPYHIVYMKGKLTEAFRSRNADSILFYAADIGHYIADANVPLHTTVNYDGQLTDQKGLHSLWESMVPEIEITNYNLKSKHKAAYLSHPEITIMEAVRRAHRLLPDVFAKEKELSAAFPDSVKYRVQMRRGKESRSYTSAFAKAYAASLKTTVNEQLLESANLIADFWYTSWVDAGRPDMTELVKPAFTEEDVKRYKAELKAYKRNELLEKNLLLSKKRTEEKTEE